MLIGGIKEVWTQEIKVQLLPIRWKVGSRFGLLAVLCEYCPNNQSRICFARSQEEVLAAVYNVLLRNLDPLFGCPHLLFPELCISFEEALYREDHRSKRND